jgi:hypothetical protein
LDKAQKKGYDRGKENQDKNTLVSMDYLPAFCEFREQGASLVTLMGHQPFPYTGCYYDGYEKGTDIKDKQQFDIPVGKQESSEDGRDEKFRGTGYLHKAACLGILFLGEQI